MRITRRDFLATGAAGAVGLAAPQANAFDSRSLKNDIALLRQAYTALHPGLYRYATPAEVASRFDELEKNFGNAQTLAEAYLTLSRFLASIRCGHTYANFYNQSSSVAAALFSGADKLPFQFRWLGNRMYVTRNLSGEALLAPGTEILEVDGRKSADILSALMRYARADGSNDAKRRALLEVRGLDRYEYFDVFYALLFPRGNSGFHITAQPYGASSAKQLAVSPFDLKQRRSTMTAPDEKSDAPAWTLTFTKENVAVLAMPSWALYDSKWDWRGFLASAFEKMHSERAKGLVIDLRGNEGGLDCGNDIIARLIDRDLPLETYERRVRFRVTPANLDSYLDTWDSSFKSLGKDATDLGDGFFRLEPEKGEDDNSLIHPKGPRFAAPVVVLIDSQNSSATFQFANTIRRAKLGTLCGEPTGGNQRGINGGAFFFFRLPASGLEADLPLIGTFPHTAKPDAGLMPDLSAVPGAADIAKGRDPAMEAAIKSVFRQ
jgi:hypothetical protein